VTEWAPLGALATLRSVEREVPIRGEMIRLGQLLKLTGTVGGGGELKDFLAGERILVNGQSEARRGRQLHPGDVVEVGSDRLHVVAGASAG
jgi:ribosome-associated protein